MPRLLDADLLDDAAAQVGEAPLWDPRTDVLVWVDIAAGLVHLSSASGIRLRTHQVGRPVGAALPSAAGGWLLADAAGFTELSDRGTLSPVPGTRLSRPDVRFNDAKCDPAGRAWGGTMAYDKTRGAGTLYRLDEGPRATPVLTELTVSNGLGWSPDAETMWFADSADPRLRAFAYDPAAGGLGAERQSVSVQSVGAPDGLCVDDEGCIWVALWGGGAVHRYTPDGRLDTVVRLPVSQVTSCAFGGSDLSTLFVTTARRHLGLEELSREPLAGALFRVDPGVTGPAAVLWQRDAVLPTG